MVCPTCKKANGNKNSFCLFCGEDLTGETTLQFTNDSEKTSNSSRNKILNTNLKYAGLLIIAIVILHFFLNTLAIMDDNLPLIHRDNESLIYFLHAIIILVFILFSYSPMGIPRTNKIVWSSNVQDSFSQFLKGWMTVWITWFLLYLYIGIMILLSKYSLGTIKNLSVQVTVDFLNACTSASFLYIFLVSDMPSVSTQKKPNRNKSFLKGLTSVVIISITIVVFAGIGRYTNEDFFSYLSGAFAAISMSYVFGRLDSHHMNVNRWLLSPLYLYAVIQLIGPKLVDFKTQPNVNENFFYQYGFFSLVLVLKIYLFFVMIHWLQSGAFERYFNDASKNFIDD